VAARKAEPGAQARGEVEWDLSVEGASGLEAVDRDKWSAREGFWLPQASPVLFRVRRWARQEVSVAELSRQPLGR